MKTVAVEEPGYTREAWGKPFIKWAGGKTQLLPHLLPMIPRDFKSYHEPFVGGGALFFALQPTHAVLADVNHELMLTYDIVKHHPKALLKKLSCYEKRYRAEGASFFYGMRAWHVIPGNLKYITTRVAVAARFIFLNKTCFNGLYRVNGKGEFNVPHGKFKSPPTICNAEIIMEAHTALKGATFTDDDFEASFANASGGDFLYADPPYVPVSATSDFTGYAKGGFIFDDQERLRDAAIAAGKRGVRVLLSNSSSPIVRDLYSSKKDLEIIEVDARRGINSDASKRGAVKELLIKTRNW